MGDNAPLRFLPSRFDERGMAIDAGGARCEEIACPNCHLRLPRAMLELAPAFLSIAGTPSCGKSYFLTSMVHRLRRVLPRLFRVSFGEADPTANAVLNEYERRQFFADDDSPVRLDKTEEQGDLYDVVNQNGLIVSYPKPFLFTARPNEDHPGAGGWRKSSRVICLYDNAGESFQPGKDTVVNPVTRHLARAHTLFYCFDPTQCPSIRKSIATRDKESLEVNSVIVRQELVLHEMAARIRKHVGLRQTEKHRRPLVVVATKFDLWSSLFSTELSDESFVRLTSGGLSVLDMKFLHRVSSQLRDFLLEHSSELVSAAESLSDQVYYVPVSATGSRFVKDPASGVYGARPSEIRPFWCEVPMLWAMAEWGGLIPKSAKME